MIKKIIKNNYASVNPILLFILTLFVCGFLYSLLFILIGLPLFKSYIPDSDSKTVILMGIYALPLIILLVGVICVFKEGLKKHIGGF